MNTANSPPSLPEPGEQPADVEAARAGVIKAYQLVFDGKVAKTESDAYLQGAADLASVRAALDQSETAKQGAGSTATVNDLVFVAPDHAWVLFQIYLNGSPWNTPRLGEAHLIDGRWQVATETWCALVRGSPASAIFTFDVMALSSTTRSVV